MSRATSTSRPVVPSPQRRQSWTRLLNSPRHAELLKPESTRSVFFTGMLLRANGEPC